MICLVHVYSTTVVMRALSNEMLGDEFQNVKEQTELRLLLVMGLEVAFVLMQELLALPLCFCVKALVMHFDLGY